MLKRILTLLVLALLAGQFINAQETTGSITGTVKTGSGEGLTGATVTATHVPSGTVYRTLVRSNGQYTISNLQPGGPYRIVTTFVGYQPDTKEDVYVNLGEVFKADAILTGQNASLSTVVVATTRAAQKIGTETILNRERIENIPTVGRTLTDYLRNTPQMRISSGGNISSEGAMSFAGQNVRFNSFYIDGAVNNDVFGLAYSGTNGGQSGIAPISIDAIDQFQVSISPYNASLGNFTGAAINAVTKSGTNTLHASAYYIFRNEDLAGKTPTGDKKLATKIPDFSNKTYGLTVGGPIIKNKLFYFVSAEIQRDQTPLNFSFSDYNGTKDPALIQRLKDTIFVRTGGFDVGGYLNNLSETKANRVTSKFDWNINDKNKLSLSYRYTYGDRIVPLDVNNNALRFETNGYRFPTTTHSASAELKSNIGTNKSNRLLVTFTNVEDDRAPLGGKLIPAVQIFDGPTASIYFGTESNSTFNYLKQSTYNLVDQFRFTLGKNNLAAGVEAELYDAYNSFIPNTAGNYRYDSIGAFFRNMAPNQYIVNYPLLGNDEQTSASGAKFKIFKGALFLNDEIRVNSNFTLNVGLRADYYKFPTTPTYERFTIDSALPKFAQYYDLKGAFPGKQPKIPLELSPRVGFTYQVPGENITVRGGFGLFAGRIPMVWPSAIYNYNGISQGGYTASSGQNQAARNNIKFRMTPYTAEEVGISLANAKGRVVLASEEYRMPKVFRSSLAFDKRFGKGWTATIEGIFTKNITDIQYTNINILPPTLKMATGPDTRTVYPSPVTIPIRSTGANPYQEVYLISNAEGRKPFAYNFTFMVTKTTRTGFYMNVSYNYGESVVLNEAQSSTPNSQWASIETVNGRNNLVLTTSDNSPGHRILANVSKRFTYANKKAYTTVSLLYTGESGQPFSYVYPGNSPAVRDQSFQTSVDLIYIPTASELQAMNFITTSSVTADAATQKTAFENYIQNDKYLRTHRGQFAERNGSRAPFSNILDLKLTQGFNLAFGKQTYAVEIGYSMFNFTNFLNRDWGRRYFVPFDNFGLLSFSYQSASNLTPRYTFDPKTAKPESVYNRFNPTYTARWMSQLEFRVKF